MKNKQLLSILFCLSLPACGNDLLNDNNNTDHEDQSTDKHDSEQGPTGMACTADGKCLDGYICVPQDGYVNGVCIIESNNNEHGNIDKEDILEGLPCTSDGKCAEGYSCSKRDGSVNGICIKTCQTSSDCENDCLYCSAATHTCEFFPAGEKIGSCSDTFEQCDGKGNCECTDNHGGYNCNSCKEGWSGNDCMECDSSHFGANCQACSCQHGTCSSGHEGNGQCLSCQENWQGVNCNECKPGYFGQNCQKCQCGSLDCDDGKNGTGGCYKNNCPVGWKGPNCDQCADRFTGTNCDQCADSRFTGPNCDKCADSRFTGANCDQCADRFTGANCDQCADRFTGANCEQCADRFTGTNCDQCADKRFIGANCDTFKDSDGNTYKTFTINNQIWMAENLRNSNVEHYSADDNSANDTKYGYLYTWENALKACPSGWRLPTKEEFDKLLSTTGAGKDSSSIRDTSWSSGSNSSGFGALPAGDRWLDGDFDVFGSYAFFWSATPLGDVRAYSLLVDSFNARVLNDDRSNAFSVRCLKD